MDIREQQNIFKLLWGGLGLVNRAGTTLVLYVIIFLLLNSLSGLLLHFNIHPIFVQLLNICFSSFLVILLWRILAAKVDNFGESFSNSITSSVIPSLYLLVFNMVMGVFSGILAFLVIPMCRYTGSIGLIFIGLLIAFLVVRLCFVIPSIALREQGPIKAIIYSWEMTSGIKNFLRTFVAILVCSILPGLFFLAVLRTLYVVIPLHFADSFNLAELTPTWYVVGGVCVLGLAAVSCWAFATFLLFFLNCDYGENRSSYTPEPEIQINSQVTQVFGEDNNVLPPGVGKVVTEQDVHVSIKKASVKTTSDDNEFKEHLEQVYQPKPEDFVQYAEEDRMPTILFDDEMAKQIEQNQQMWTKKEEPASKSDDKNNEQSIKMSK